MPSDPERELAADMLEAQAALDDAEASLLDDDRATAGWQRRAVGVPRDEALAQVPRVGTLQAQLPIEAMRRIQAHIAAREVNQAVWVREAIVARYLREGGDQLVAAAALDVLVDRRRRDVPRDVYGQERRRYGRRGRTV